MLTRLCSSGCESGSLARPSRDRERLSAATGALSRVPVAAGAMHLQGVRSRPRAATTEWRNAAATRPATVCPRLSLVRRVRPAPPTFRFDLSNSRTRRKRPWARLVAENHFRPAESKLEFWAIAPRCRRVDVDAPRGQPGQYARAHTHEVRAAVRYIEAQCAEPL